MFNATDIAGEVARWGDLGIKLPKALASALEVFEAVRWTEVGYAPQFDFDSLTAANAEAKIRELASQVALTVPGQTGQSVLGAAKEQVMNAAARRVLAAARAAVPEAIKQLSGPFGKAAQAYAEAVSKLPDEISSDRLLVAGAAVVEAYGQARAAAGYLDGISSWVAGTANLGGYLSGEIEATLRILRPTSGHQIVKLDEAHRLNASSALSAIGPVYFAAVKLGVEFGINTLAEAKHLRESLALRPQKLVTR